jgi:hypothetical protein
VAFLSGHFYILAIIFPLLPILTSSATDPAGIFPVADLSRITIEL